MAQDMVDARIFESLQAKIDEESDVREKLKEVVQTLEKQIRTSQALLARAHSTPSSQLTPTLDEAAAALATQVATVSRLSTIANAYPYHKYANAWTRQIQDLTGQLLTAEWLRTGQLLTIEQVGQALGVPANVKERDEFHLTIEEYLQALVTVIDELARLAVNSVTLGDYARPVQISRFVKEVHAGFQLLNLKNDSLRRRSDGIKYSVKKVEDVVYDLSLRNLIPGASADAGKEGGMEVS